MKKTSVLSIILLIAFFLPWVDFSFITFSGYQLPKAIHQLSSLGGQESPLIFLVYSVYLIPIISILNIATDLKLINFNKSFKKFDFYLAVLVCVYMMYTALERSTNFFSFLGIGFFITAIVAIIGLFIKNDKVIFELPTKVKSNATENTDVSSQLAQLKALADQELISQEEYQQKKTEILNKMG